MPEYREATCKPHAKAAQDFVPIKNQIPRMDIGYVRNNFHQLIDQIEDEAILHELYQLLLNYQQKQENGDFRDNMTDEQKQELEQALAESESDENLISHEEVMNRARKWKKTVVWRKKAADKFLHIVAYLHDDWSAKEAKQFIDRVELQVQLLSRFPH